MPLLCLRPATWDSRSTLLGQGILAFNMEVSGCHRRSSIGLASPYADGVVPLRDDWISFLSHHAQVARIQFEMHLLTCARIEMNAFESTQSDAGSALDRRELEIELHNLISRNLTGI